MLDEYGIYHQIRTVMLHPSFIVRMSSLPVYDEVYRRSINFLRTCVCFTQLQCRSMCC